MHDQCTQADPGFQPGESIVTSTKWSEKRIAKAKHAVRVEDAVSWTRQRGALKLSLEKESLSLLLVW